VVQRLGGGGLTNPTPPHGSYFGYLTARITATNPKAAKNPTINQNPTVGNATLDNL